jgi:predicted O-linked N-acetylglucosamine transferase (SPINDLY family)
MVSIRRTANPESNLKIARSWSRCIAQESAARSPRPIVDHGKTALQNDRIRIGYLSGDFKDHAIAHQIRGMLAAHNRNQFEIIGYTSNPDDGTAYRRYLESACDRFKPIHNLSDTAAAQLIYDDGVHILVDLSAHSRDNRMGVTALRPAPIQVSYLGFLGTTGADFIDYVIADKIVVPPAEAKFYSENIVYMPHCYQVNDDQLSISNRAFSRKEFDLPPEGVVFCSFNQPYKIDRQIFEIWLNILKSIKGSVLWLVQRSGLAKDNLIRAAESGQVDPARLIFTGFLPLELNLARLRLADLVLDTRIYNGGATTSNALWAGVPVLTVRGSHWVSRMSESALVALGLPELVTSNLQNYQQLAIDLANHPTKLKALRNKLAKNRKIKPLFNTTLFTRHIESAFCAMWDRHANSLPPVALEVKA